MIAASASVLVLVSTRHGLSATPDSVFYAVAARSLSNGHGYLDFTGRGVTLWPPGFPSLLAAGLKLGLSLEASVRAINAASAALVVWLTFVLGRRTLQSERVALVACVVVAVSPTMLRAQDSIWSESMFCVLTLVFLLLLDESRTRPHALSIIALAGLTAGAATLVRYLGLSLILAGALFIPIALARKVRPLLVREAVFLVAGSAVVAPWLVRNSAIDGTLFGSRGGGGARVTTTTTNLLRAIGRTLVPDQVPEGLTEGSAIVLLLSGLLLFGWCRPSGSQLRSVSALALVVGLLLGFATLTFFLGGATDLDARVLAPAFAPGVLLGLWLYERARHRAQSDPTQRMVSAAALLFSVWLIGLMIWSAGLAWSHGRQGRGIAAPEVRDSGLVRVVRHTPARAILLTNDPLPLGYWMARTPILLVGDGSVSSTGVRSVPVRQLRRLACTRPVLYARSDRKRRLADEFAAASRGELAFELLRQFAGGSLSRVRPADPGACTRR